jgi:hypothetical protein
VLLRKLNFKFLLASNLIKNNISNPLQSACKRTPSNWFGTPSPSPVSMHWQALPATLREEKLTEIKGTYRTDKKEKEIFLI